MSQTAAPPHPGMDPPTQRYDNPLLCSTPPVQEKLDETQGLFNPSTRKKTANLLFPHLKNAHPVPGVGLEGRSEGVAAGDGG